MTLYDALKGISDDYAAVLRSQILPVALPLDDKVRATLTERRDALYLATVQSVQATAGFVTPAYERLTTCEALVNDLWARLPYVIPKRSLWEWFLQGPRKERELAPADSTLITELGGSLIEFKRRPKYELENHCIGPLKERARFVDDILAVVRAYEERKRKEADAADQERQDCRWFDDGGSD
jgi:hypothetical protein